MSTYLAKRNSTYYFRFPIPVALRAAMGGKAEIMKSLRTKDREEAKRLIPAHTAAAQRLLHDATTQQAKIAKSTPTDSPAPLSAKAARLELSRFEQEREADEFHQQRAEEQEQRRATREHFRRHWEKRLALTTAELSPEEAALKDLLKDKDFDLTLANERLAAQSVTLSAARKANDPEILLTPTSASVTITGLYEGYVSQGRLTASTIPDWRASIKKFVAFLGHNDPNRVSSQDVMRWRNQVRAEPKSNGETRSAQRVTAGYLAPVKAAFAYGLENFLISNDPAKGVAKPKDPRKLMLREKDFTKDEQKLILSAALIPPVKKLSAPRILALRWVPWLCAYTGARVNEISQLRTEDVTQIDGHWVIRITPEAGNVKTKSVRVVPLHEHLVEQGFLAMVEDHDPGPMFYSPSDDAEPVPEGRRGAYKKTGEFLAAWVRSLGITDPDIKPNHAWRHTFKTLAIDVGMAERAADYMQGHATKGVGRTYGSNNVPALADEMAKIPRFSTE